MKIKHYFFLTIALLSVLSLNLDSQNVIALEHAGSTTIYSNLDSAMVYAVDNDNIYLPRGSFTPSGGVLNISKKLNIIGAVHYTDSIIATGQTIINGVIRIKTGADGGSLQGVYITGNVYFGSNSSDNIINGYNISRCYLASELILNYTTALNPLVQNISLNESIIIGIVYLADAQNLLISKNIFQS